MKKTFLLKTMLLLCALVVGSSAWAGDVVGTINFGSASGSTKIEGAASSGTGPVTYTDTGNDSQGNSWTITTVTSNTKSFTQNASYSQVGSSDNPVTSITFTTTLPENQTIKAFSAKFGGFKNTAGTVKLKVGTTEVGSGSLNAGNDVTVSATNTTTSGTVLTVTVTNIAKGVKCYYISYTYDDGSSSSIDPPTISPAAGAVTAGTTVTLTQAAADEIRYTTNGTIPTKTTGTVYSTPIAITTSTTIKAIAIKGDDVSSVATASYTISVDSPSFSLEGGSYMAGTTVTITSTGNTVYYTTDGSTNPTSSSTEYTDPIALTVGKVTYKAIAYDSYGNTSSVVTRTYTGIDTASLPFSWTGTSSAGKSALGNVTGVAGYSLGSDYASSNAPYRLKFEAVNNYVTIFTNEKPETVYFTAKLFNAANTGSKIKVQGSADGITFTDIEEFTISGAANATFEFTTTHAFNTTHRAVKLVMSSKDQNVGVGTISISCLPVKITNAEYATFSNAHALDFSNTGIKVYTAKDNENSVTLSEVTTGKVPANTPVVLYKAGGATINVPVIASAPAITATNDLRVSDGTTTLSNAYVLAKPDGQDVGFYPWGSSTLSAGKVYLQGVSPTRDFIGIGDASGISNVKVNTNLDGNYYDLQGRQVAQPTKGLYIVNGKKVFVK